MLAIFKRELQGYFYTAAAYVYTGVFLALGCVFFAVNNLAARSGDLNSLLWMMGYLWMLLTPILTMRSFAGERKARTDQLLLTSPVSLWGITLGKFLAACAVLLLTVILSLVYVLIVALYGKVYVGETAVGYLGFVLQGCAFIALDMLVSARCRTPMTAAIFAFGCNLFLWLMDVLNAAVDITFVNQVLSFLSPYQRCQAFKMGQLSFADAVYFVSVIFLCLFLMVRSLDARRWREA
jgi:ABC-2 type transport system permease protein